MGHPLHLAVAEAVAKRLTGLAIVVKDPACGGDQYLPLFLNDDKRRETRMCCVDLLVILSEKVRVIAEIEESGFHPTKVCGKFFQAALATQFIHDSRPESVVPYGDKVLFIEVLDGSKFPQEGSQKEHQAKRIERRICELLVQLKTGISDYQLHVINGATDVSGVARVSEAIFQAVNAPSSHN